MNNVALTGRPTKDPEDFPGVTKFTLAVPRRKPGETDFITCVSFGKTAEFVSKYVKKGTLYAITGHIQTGSYEKDGRKVYTTVVIIENVEFCERKKDDLEPAVDDNPFV